MKTLGRQFRNAVLLMGISVVTSTAWASLLEVHSPSFAGSFGSVETGARGIGFRAESSFSITSLGIFGDIAAGSYKVAIRSSTNGRDAGEILTSRTAVSGGNGASWQDIPLDFSFSAGNYYTMEWGAASGFDWIQSGIDFFSDQVLSDVVGPMTLIDGYYNLAGLEPDFANTLNPRLRVNLTGIPPQGSRPNSGDVPGPAVPASSPGVPEAATQISLLQATALGLPMIPINAPSPAPQANARRVPEAGTQVNLVQIAEPGILGLLTLGLAGLGVVRRRNRT